MKTTYLLLFDLILALTFRTAQAGDNDSAVREGRLSLDEVTNVVLANNPAIKAAQEKWRAMKARVPQAAAWEDLRAQARSRAARYVSIPANFRCAIAAQRADESASAGATRPAISDSVSTTALFIASVASCSPERTTGNAASTKPRRSRKIPP